MVSERLVRVESGTEQCQWKMLAGSWCTKHIYVDEALGSEIEKFHLSCKHCKTDGEML